jgi:hypothetical protein
VGIGAGALECGSRVGQPAALKRDVNTSGLAPGIALGTFSSEEAAQEGLQQAERRNVRTARVVQERAESLSYSLRLPAIGETLRARIEGLGPAMAGRSLQRCA